MIDTLPFSTLELTQHLGRPSTLHYVLQAIYALESESCTVGEAYYFIQEMQGRIDCIDDEIPSFMSEQETVKVRSMCECILWFCIV